MAVLRRTSIAAFAGLSLASCALFSDFGGLTGGGADAAGVDASDGAVVPGDGSGSSDGPATVVDAGPDAPAYKLAVLEDEPIAYWPMDDAPGCAVVAEIVGGKKAEFAGTLGCGAPGVSGTAIDKTNVDQILEVGDYFDFVGFVPYTIEAWAKPKFQAQYLTMIAKRRPNTEYGWNFYFQRPSVTDTPGFQMLHTSPDGGNRTVFVATPDAEATFHHIVVTYDPNVATGAPLRMYYDGVRTDGYDDDIPAIDTTEPVWIGQAYTGLLDEIALYDHALTVERVQLHYQLGKN